MRCASVTSTGTTPDYYLDDKLSRQIWPEPARGLPIPRIPFVLRPAMRGRSKRSPVETTRVALPSYQGVCVCVCGFLLQRFLGSVESTTLRLYLGMGDGARHNIGMLPAGSRCFRGVFTCSSTRSCQGQTAEGSGSQPPTITITLHNYIPPPHPPAPEPGSNRSCGTPWGKPSQAPPYL